MIHINVTGRCGNQFFQYAFARKLSLITGDEEFKFDFFNVNRWRNQTDDASFDDQLQHFNVAPYTSVCDNENVFDIVASSRQKRAYKLDLFMRKVFIKLTGTDALWLLKNEPQLNRLGIYYHETASTAPVGTKEREKLIKGYFERKYYFDDIKEVLFREFTPKYPEKEKNRELYKVIRENESVCVSFRKWGEVPDDVKKERDVCGKDYYEKAVEEMLRRVPNAVLIVFSDDVDWVKKNFDFGNVSVFFEDGTDEIWEKMRMMYSCKHFIMTTSTFTWWAQYLCRNEDKIVISPDHWYNGGKESALIDQDWVLIH